MVVFCEVFFFFSSRRRHTRCALVTGVQTCALSISGQAIGAKLAHPERQVCLLLGDGAFGFSGMEFDTMARHGLPIVGVVGNNGIWALERSEERRGGKEWVSTCRSRWSPDH